MIIKCLIGAIFQKYVPIMKVSPHNFCEVYYNLKMKKQWTVRKDNEKHKLLWCVVTRVSFPRPFESCDLPMHEGCAKRKSCDSQSNAKFVPSACLLHQPWLCICNVTPWSLQYFDPLFWQCTAIISVYAGVNTTSRLAFESTQI